MGLEREDFFIIGGAEVGRRGDCLIRLSDANGSSGLEITAAGYARKVTKRRLTEPILVVELRSIRNLTLEKLRQLIVRNTNYKGMGKKFQRLKLSLHYSWTFFSCATRKEVEGELICRRSGPLTVHDPPK